MGLSELKTGSWLCARQAGAEWSVVMHRATRSPSISSIGETNEDPGAGVYVPALPTASASAALAPKI
ncbi:hypothetical protein GCM10007276_33520 [Agaricicola taiwanensis]|uniref:Uncharacterized protein n=1 Tax=Agaricicola taiwanensis TaxID=591372 RepID=A0A8J2YN50_9RHOB|nr:hypothetical protein GCM10007276_33520 [Agaricicola taiwanensis]